MHNSSSPKTEAVGLSVFTWSEIKNSRILEISPKNVDGAGKQSADLIGHVLHVAYGWEIEISTIQESFISIYFIEGQTLFNSGTNADEWVRCEPISESQSDHSPFLVRVYGPFLIKLRTTENSYIHLFGNAEIKLNKQRVNTLHLKFDSLLPIFVDDELVKSNFSKNNLSYPEKTLFVSRRSLEKLKILSNSNEKKRFRLNLHRSNSEAVQDMVIAFNKETDVPCSRHMDKSEIIFLLLGSLRINLYDDNLILMKRVLLSSFSHSNPSVVHIPKCLIHSFEFLSPAVITREITTGPFRPELTESFSV